MDVVDVDAESLHTLSIAEIDKIVRNCFTNEEWRKMSYHQKVKYRIMFSVYKADPRNAELYTFEEYLKVRTPEPEKLFPHITGSPVKYPDPEPFDKKFWHTFTTCDKSSSDESGSELQMPHKRTLEEMWDESDAEHERERALQRALDEKKKETKGKRGRKKNPPAKRGRKKKTPAPKPKLTTKPPGKRRGRRPKNTVPVSVPPSAIPTLRSKSAPVTRSQTAAGKTEALEAAPKTEPIDITESTETGVTQKDEVISVAEKTEEIDVALETEAIDALQDIEAISAGKKAEAMAAAQKIEAINDVKKIRGRGAVQKAMAAEVTQRAAVDRPISKKIRTPRRRFIPPPPPSCFFNRPPYKRRNVIDLSIPPIPSPSFQNVNFNRPRVEKYWQPKVADISMPFPRYNRFYTPAMVSKYPPGIVDLTKPSTSSVFVNRRLQPPPQYDYSQPSTSFRYDYSQPSTSFQHGYFQPTRRSYIPKLPPPLAPLSNILPIGAGPSARVKPSTSATPSTSTEFISPAPTVQPSRPLPYNLRPCRSNRFFTPKIGNMNRKPAAKTSTMYYVPKSKQPVGTVAIVNPGFYVPRTLEELPGQPQPSIKINVTRSQTLFDDKSKKPSTLVEIDSSSSDNQTVKEPTTSAVALTSVRNVTEKPVSSNKYAQQTQTSFYSKFNMPRAPVTSLMPQSTATSSLFVPTVQANTATPYSLTYVKSHQDSMKQLSTSSTYTIPEASVTVSLVKAKEESTLAKKKVDPIGVTPPTISFLPRTIPEREKRIQPKRIKRPKFIVVPKSQTIVISKKESETLNSRQFQDITKFMENQQNIANEEKTPNKEGITKAQGIIPVDKSSQEVGLPDIDSSDTDVSTEKQLASKKPVVKKQLSKIPIEKPPIKVPPHVKPCPTHAPATSTQTKTLVTRTKITPIIMQPKDVPNSPEVRYVKLPDAQLLTFQQAHADELLNLTRPRGLGPVPVHETVVQTQLRTYQGPASRIPKIIQPSPPVIIAQTVANQSIETPVVQTVLVKPSVCQSSSIQPTVSQSDSSSSPSDEDQEIITVEFSSEFNQSQIQAFTIAQQVNPEEILGTANRSSDEEITEFTETKPKKVLKAPQYELIRVPKIQTNKTTSDMLTPGITTETNQVQLKTIPSKSEKVQTTLAPNKSTATTQTQISIPADSPDTMFPVKVTTQSEVKSIPAPVVQTSGTSAANKPTLSTQSQIVNIPAPIIHTSDISAANKPLVLTQSQIKSIPTKIIRKPGILPANDPTVTTRPQIKPVPAKIIRSFGTSDAHKLFVTTLAQTKSLPGKIVQTSGTPAANKLITVPTQSQIKTIPTKIVQTSGTPAANKPITVPTQSQMKTIPTKIVQTLGLSPANTPIGTTHSQIKLSPSKMVQTLGTLAANKLTVTSQTEIKNMPAELTQTAGTSPNKPGLTTQTQMKTVSAPVIQATGRSPLNNRSVKTEPQTETVPAQIVHTPSVSDSNSSITPQTKTETISASIRQTSGSNIPVLQLKKIVRTQQVNQPEGHIKVIPGSSTGTQGPARKTQVKKIAKTIPVTRRGTGEPVKKSAQAGQSSVTSSQPLKTKTTPQGSSIPAKPAFTPIKVAQFQKLLSQVQASTALSRSAKVSASTPQNIPTEDIKSSAKHTDLGQNFTGKKVLAQTHITTPKSSTSPVSRPQSIQILAAGRALSHETGLARIPLLQPGIYQVVRNTSTITSKSTSDTPDEIRPGNLKRNIRLIIGPKKRFFASTSTSICTTTTASTPRFPLATIPEEEETSMNIDEDDMATRNIGLGIGSTTASTGHWALQTIPDEEETPMNTDEDDMDYIKMFTIVHVPMEHKNDPEFYAPREILDHRRAGSKTEYLVKWITLLGNNELPNSWENSKYVLKELAMQYEEKIVLREIRNQTGQHQKRKNRSPIFWKAPGYFGILDWKNLKVTEICGAMHFGEPRNFYFCIKFKHFDDLFLVSKNVANRKCPQLVIQFYEQNFDIIEEQLEKALYANYYIMMEVQRKKEENQETV